MSSKQWNELEGAGLAQMRGPFAFADEVRVERNRASMSVAVAVHVALLLMLLALAARHGVQMPPIFNAPTVVPPETLVMPRAGMSSQGGNTSATAASEGQPPRPATVQMIPVAPATLDPMLPVPPTMAVQTDVKIASTVPELGAPDGTGKTFSLGRDGRGGVGDGPGPGVGMEGDGARPEQIGGAVHAPVLVYSVDPQFSEEARQKKFSGNVQVYLWVDEHGNASHVRVVRGVGMGLDEQAVAAVRQYKFKPALKFGKPVKVDMYIDVDFHIF
jgi:protein TonB